MILKSGSARFISKVHSVSWPIDQSINFDNALKISYVLQFPPPIKLTLDITEIMLKVTLSTMSHQYKKLLYNDNLRIIGTNID